MANLEGVASNFFQSLGRLAQDELPGIVAQTWGPTAARSVSKECLDAVARKAISSTEPELPSIGIKQLTKILETGQLTYSPKPAELDFFSHVRTGVVSTSSGFDVSVIERSMTLTKAATELKVARVSELMPFSDYVPATTIRSPGLVLQQKVGLSLEDWAKRMEQQIGRTSRPWDYDSAPQTFQRYFEQNVQFHFQLEQAQVRRSILGDFDSTPANFAIGMRRRSSFVSNIDMNQAFEVGLPRSPNIKSLQALKLSERTLNDVDTFSGFLRSGLGRDSLAAIGVKPEEFHFVQLRTEWYLKHKRFAPL